MGFCTVAAERCESAQPLTMAQVAPRTWALSMSASFAGSSDDLVTSCGVAGQRDLVYAVDLPDEGDLEISATTTTGRLPVALRLADCATEYRCTTSRPLHAAGRPFGRVIVVVEAPAGTTDFQLELTFHRLSRGEHCSIAPDMGFTCSVGMPDPSCLSPGFIESAGFEGYRGDLPTATCGSPGADRSWMVVLTGEAELRVEATSGVPLVAALFSDVDGGADFCEAAAVVACSTGSGAVSIGPMPLPAGRYHVTIAADGLPTSDAGVTVGLFRSRYRYDRCTALSLADRLPLVSGRASISGTTSLYFDDEAPSCIVSGGGPDAFHAVEVPHNGRLEATVVGSNFSPIVALHAPSDGGSCGPELECESAIVSSQPGPLVTGPLDAGLYVLHVDGRFGGSGPYRLDVDVR